MEGGSVHLPFLSWAPKSVQDMFLQRVSLHDSSNSTMMQHLCGWPEIYSPCFWTGTFGLVHLVFIMTVLSQFLFKRMKLARSERNDHLSKEQKYADLKLGISYKASIGCCLFILATHVLKIALFQLNVGLSDCKYPYFLLAEGLQVLSWIILSLAVFSFKTKSAKLPWISRAWWIFNFVQSVAQMLFDLRSNLPEHEYIGLKKCIDLLTLVICTHLFAMSVRGNTGITFVDSSTTEPLLSSTAGQQAETKSQCLYGRASLIDLVTFSWMNPVFAIGYKRPLEKNDVPDVDVTDSAEFLSDSFKKIIATVEGSHGLTTSSIYKAMFLLIRRKAVINAGFAALNAIATFVGPSLINDLVKFLGGDQQYGRKRGFLLAVAFLTAKVVETLAQRQWIFGARQLGMRLRAALISHVYQKGLSLSCSSRQKHTSGEIMNYMSVDIQRISDVIWYANYIWMLPIQLSLAVYILHRNLGVAAWVSLAATLTITSCNIPLTRMQKNVQAKIMAAKDDRMKATTEVLRSMKTLKLQAWEMQYLTKIEALRSVEYNWLWRSARLSALIQFTFWASPGFISSITFGSCILMGIPLTAGTVLSALATFQMLQDPIFQLPDLLSVFAQGIVSADRVAKYLRAVQGGALVPVTIAAQSFFQIFQVGSNYWMAWASPSTCARPPTVGLGLLFSVYIALSMGCALCVLARALLVSLVGLLTSEKFFKNMLHCIMRAPMSFFDSTPTGRILNRASNDQSVLDLEVAIKLGWCAFSSIKLLGTIVVMSQVAWPVFAIFIPVMVACFLYQRYYIPTARELARLSQIQRAPILHHFVESLSGASSIRAYGRKDCFRKANLSLIDNHSRPWFHNLSSMEWLSFRLNMLSNSVFAFSLALLVSLPQGFINPSIAGLAVTYALNLNSQLASIIWNICNTEDKMISVERILQYSRLPSEAPLVVEYSRPSNSGSGKSTLIQALFRIVEPREGIIEIDGVDISKIGLHDLRGRLSIIPQDPTMFEGTVRGNLDPLNEYPDQRVWEILDKCQLGDIVRQSPKKLYSTVVENGETWSVGQRQLFCLGRVLLKRSNILVLDEATASVDSSTDTIIQETIRKEFGDCTVLTIAHRIHTVIDSDLILVFSEGKIIEYDTPLRLLENKNSEFSRFIKEYSQRSKRHNNAASG